MDNKTIMTFLGMFLLFAANAQTIPQHIDIDAAHCLKANETLHLKAYESIRIGEGFTMEPGSSLRLEVIPKSDDTNDRTVAGTPVVYPNPSAITIIIRGVYDKAPATIFDDSGNAVLKLTLDGANPVIDISPLRNGSYFLRASNFTTRFIKE